MCSAEKFGAVTGERRAAHTSAANFTAPSQEKFPSCHSPLVYPERLLRRATNHSSLPLSNRYWFRIEMPVSHRKQGTGNFLIVTQNATYQMPARVRASPTPCISNRELVLLQSGLSRSKQTTAALPNRELSTVLRMRISINSALPQREKECGSPGAPEQSKIAAKKSSRERREPS